MKKLKLAILGCSLCFLQFSNAATFDVSTVQELKNAVLQAQNNGEEDTINLHGSFKLEHHIEIFQDDNLPITIQGNNGKASLSSKDGRVFYIPNAKADMTFKNLVFKGSKTEKAGGVLFFESDDDANILIENCEFSKNTTAGRGALYIHTYGRAIIRNSKFSKNKVIYNSLEERSGKGGGAYIFANSGIEITNSIFENNFAQKKGGGAFLSGDGEKIIENNVIKGNKVKYKYGEYMDVEDVAGGGFYIYDGDLTFKNNTVEKNYCNGIGGGIYADISSNATLENNTFKSNESLSDGSGFYFYGEELTSKNNIFEKNKADYINVEDEEFSCGTLFVEGNDVVIRDSKFIKNSNTSGSGLCSDVENIEISNSVFSDNKSYIYGGAVFGFVEDSALITNNIFDGNGGTKTKKFKIEDGTIEVGTVGGAIFLAYPNHAEITDNIFNENEAAFIGGGLFYSSSELETFYPTKLSNLKILKKFKTKKTKKQTISEDAEIIIKNNKFYGNEANLGGGGAAIFPENTTFIENNEFIENEVKKSLKNKNTNSGGLLLQVKDSNAYVINNIFAKNKSKGSIGGVFISASNPEEVDFINNTVYQNKAKKHSGGTAILIDTEDLGNLNIYNNIFYDNRAGIKGGEDLAINSTEETLFTVNLMNNILGEHSNFDNPNSEDLLINTLNIVNYNHSGNQKGDPDLDKTYHLTANSIAIDTGDNSAPLLPDYDIDGQDRIFNGIVDIGADEYNNNPILTVNPKSVNFGTFEVGEESKSQKLKVANLGIGDLVINAVLLSGTNPSDFEITKEKCTGKVLKRGKSCEIKVIFKPLTDGDKIANLEIQSNDPNSPTTVELIGTATPIPPGEIEVNPMSLNFGNYGIGYTSKKLKVKVKNITDNKNAKLIIQNVAIDGADSDQFEIYKDKCSGEILKKGKSCEVQIVFKPTSVGNKAAVLVIESNDTDEPEVDVDLSGKGEDGDIYVKPESYDFGEVGIGDYEKKTFKVKNQGYGKLIINNVSLSGTDANQFEVYENKCQGKELKRGKSCEIKVKFIPNSIGNKTAILVINSNDTDKPEVDINLTGSAEGGDIYVSHTSYNFGNVKVGKYKKKTFKVKNKGLGTLTINNVSLTGSTPDQFEIYEDKCTGKTLKKGKSCEIKAKFKPASQGLKEANIQIASDDPDTPIFNIDIQGTGYTD